MLSRPCINTFIIHVYSLHLRFAVSALGDDFATKKKQRKKKVIFISLYLLMCNILCSTVSYLIRCVVVTACKMIFIQRVSKSWQKKKKSSHKVIICHIVRTRHVVTCTLHRENLKEGWSLKMLDVKTNIKKPGNWQPLSGL